MGTRRLFDIATYIVLGLIALLFLGRFLWLPVSLFIVSGRSMEPTLHIGDLVVGVRREPRIGDIVVYCVSRSRIYCVVHRLIGFDEHGSPITKGDANPAPDPPMAREILYIVTLAIPRYLWIPPMVLLLGFYAAMKAREYLERERLGAAKTSLEILTIGILIIWFAAYIVVALSAPRQPLLPESLFPKPSVALVRAVYSNNYSSLEIILRPTGVKLLAVSGVCSAYTSSGRLLATFPGTIRGNTVVITLPPQFWRELLNSSRDVTTYYRIRCLIALDKGYLHLSLPMHFTWRLLDIKVLENQGLFTIANPNPVPINTSYSLITYTKDRFGRTALLSVYRGTLVLAPLSKTYIAVPPGVWMARLVLRYKVWDEEIVYATKLVLSS